ncbi:MAG: hypothetical protein KAW41_03325 [Candidatus Diapherotrites archaeon]|nr:hypothetical protein [Candidatus Diapherotrites archaeon]
MIAHRWEMKAPERKALKKSLAKSDGKANAVMHLGFFGGLEEGAIPGYSEFLGRVKDFLRRDKKPVFFFVPHNETPVMESTIKNMGLGVPVVIVPTFRACAVPAHKDKKKREEYTWPETMKQAKEFEEAQWKELASDLEGLGVRELAVGGEVGGYKRFGEIAEKATSVEKAVKQVRRHMYHDISRPRDKERFIEGEIARKIAHGKKNESKAVKWFKKGFYPRDGCVGELLVSIARHSDQIKLRPLANLMWENFPGDKELGEPKEKRVGRIKRFFKKVFRQ